MWFSRKECSQGCGTKICWFLVHLLCVGLLLALYSGFQHSILAYTWYGLLYLLLLAVTVGQYLWTAGSSPGYVLENAQGTSDTESGLKVTSGRCPYCRAIQPLRTKHCYDCDKCVLRFDHHCAWLGTCIGQRNHRRFWWYVLFETALCIWTCALYFLAYRRVSKNWLQDIFLLVMFVGLLCCSIFLATLLAFHSYLVATNQTTYEKTRRKRIPYLKSLPADVRPFSKGLTKNVYEFCCGSVNRVYALPQNADETAALKVATNTGSSSSSSSRLG